MRSSHPESINRRGRGRRPRARLNKALQGRRSPRWGSKFGADRSAPRDRQAVRWGNQTALYGGSGDDAFLCAGGARCVARTGSRASSDRSRVGHRGGFSRLESGTTTPLPPSPQK